MIEIESQEIQENEKKINYLQKIFSAYFCLPVSIRSKDARFTPAEQVILNWDRILDTLNGTLSSFGSKPSAEAIGIDSVRVLAPNPFVLDKLKSNEQYIISWCEKEIGVKVRICWEVHDSQAHDGAHSHETEIVTKIEDRAGDNTVEDPLSSGIREGKVMIQGRVFLRDFKAEKDSTRFPALLYLGVFDGKQSVKAKAVGETAKKIAECIGEKDSILISGTLGMDPKTSEPVLSIVHFEKIQNNSEKAESSLPESKKHIELHIHSQLSAMDSILPLSEAVRRAKELGQKALGITDHEVVQAFPDFFELCQSNGIKPIFGMEGNVVDLTPILLNIEKVYPGKEEEFLSSSWENETFCVIDFETTGLSPLRDEMIEVGAVRMKEGKIIDSFQSFIKPTISLTAFTTELTGITNEMVSEAPDLAVVMPKLLEYIGTSVIVGHNVNFDYQFLLQGIKKTAAVPKRWITLDTLALSRSLLQMKNYTLDKVVKKVGLVDENGETLTFKHHRAIEDARVTGFLLRELLTMAKKMNRLSFEEIQNLQSEIPLNRLHGENITLFVQNKAGLKNLYRLVSLSHLDYYGKVPLIPKNTLIEYREGLLIGTGSPMSELAKAYRLGKEKEEILEICKFYDFIEIMPPDAFTDVEEGISEEGIKEMYRTFFGYGQETGIPVIMSSNVHYLDPEDHKAWSVLKISDYALRHRGQKITADKYDAVKLHYRTTEELLEIAAEMLGGEQEANEVVVDAPELLAEKIELIRPITRKLHPPIIDGADEEIKNLTLKNLAATYGETPPQIVTDRVKKELDAIIGNGYAVLYLIAQKIVARSLKDGYMVGSRGSVGSSLVATLLEITEVNPMPPHYICDTCYFCEFTTDESVTSGYDLPDKMCPNCKKKMKKNGQTIPFETFMGFKGNKVPDIDLNFSGEYQIQAHRCIEELFGSEHVFRAGTISTVAEKTAYGYVLRYEETTGIKLPDIEKERIAKSIAGVKRTTGQHPGGLMIVPKNYDVFDFTPVQRPANDTRSEVKTTHFDYNSIHEDLVKIDALGHDDPTFMRFLQDCTNVNPLKIPMDDRKVIELFSGLRPLKIRKGQIPDVDTGTLGIPEFGTGFVRGMLKETKPKSFADLVRISGLSHGTDVWLNNARDLIVTGKTLLSEVIACRDDIMIDLIQRSLEPIQAFSIMERVRKGKGLTTEEEVLMKGNGVPGWFLDSCKKIKYLFPKAHAVAYVSMGFRVAFFKLYFPLAFYSAFFSIKGWDFDMFSAQKSAEELRNSLINPDTAKNGEQKSKNKAENEKFMNEVALEMLLRGYTFLPVDILKSHPYVFRIENGALRIPLNKVPGLGEKVAVTIEKAREEKPFTSIEDLKKRTSVSNTVLELLKQCNALGNLSETSQYTLF
jgi:DNA polymerase-3 subunit alpha (Gram-positive type)